MATAATIDWSWSQACQIPTLPNDHSPSHNTPACSDCGVIHSPQASHPPNWLTKREFKINEFRMAVPLDSGPVQAETRTHDEAMVQDPPEPQSQSRPLVRHATDQSTASKAGRKRSCAEISSDDSSPRTGSSHSDSSASPTKISQLNGEDVDVDMDANGTGSANGVWADELAARLQSSSFPGYCHGYSGEESGRERRPTMESRKSIRLDPSCATTTDPLDSTIPMSTTTPSLPSLATEVPIDEAAQALGASWSTLPLTPSMTAASRGWARHIEMNFPLMAVRIVWVNKALPAFLVEAVTANPKALEGSGSPHTPGTLGFWLFDEALTQGRLVAKSWERAVDNLRAGGVFEGEGIVEARRLESDGAVQGLSAGEEGDPGGMEVDE